MNSSPITLKNGHAINGNMGILSYKILSIYDELRLTVFNIISVMIILAKKPQEIEK